MGLSSVVRHLILVLGILLVLQSVSVGIVAEVPKRDDGIHTQPWIRSLTFLDLKEDLTEAKKAGKGLVVLFEQPGCVSCKRLHEVNYYQELRCAADQHVWRQRSNGYGRQRDQ